MINNVHCHRFKLTTDERAQVERRLGFAVGRCSPRVEKVAIAFSDVNSARGGLDKQCSIAWHDGLEDLFVEDEETDPVPPHRHGEWKVVIGGSLRQGVQHDMPHLSC